MVQRPVLGRVEKAILKEIDFYGKKKHVYPYKKINITVQIQSVWQQEVLDAKVSDEMCPSGSTETTTRKVTVN